MSQAGSVPRRSAAPFRVLELASPATAACGRLLAEAGCDLGQGYFMSRPLVADRLEPWLAQWQPPAPLPANVIRMR